MALSKKRKKLLGGSKKFCCQTYPSIKNFFRVPGGAHKSAQRAGAGKVKYYCNLTGESTHAPSSFSRVASRSYHALSSRGPERVVGQMADKKKLVSMICLYGPYKKQRKQIMGCEKNLNTIF